MIEMIRSQSYSKIGDDGDNKAVCSLLSDSRRSTKFPLSPVIDICVPMGAVIDICVPVVEIASPDVSAMQARWLETKRTRSGDSVFSPGNLRIVSTTFIYNLSSGLTV